MGRLGAPSRVGVRWLLGPKLRTRINRARSDDGRVFKAALLGSVGLFFWALIFAVIFRMLLYFRGTQGIGDLLAEVKKLREQLAAFNAEHEALRHKGAALSNDEADEPLQHLAGRDGPPLSEKPMDGISLRATPWQVCSFVDPMSDSWRRSASVSRFAMRARFRRW